MVLEPDPIPARSVRVTVPFTALQNLDQMRMITQKVLERLGCPACHSGFDIRFRHEEDLLVRLDAKGVPSVIGSSERG
jgi:hypothetical protein